MSSNPISKPSRRLIQVIYIAAFYCCLFLSPEETRAQDCKLPPGILAAGCKCVNDPQALIKGVAVSRSFKPGDSYCFSVDVKEADQYFEIGISSPRNVYLYVTVCGPNNSRLTKMYSSFGSTVGEVLTLVAEVPGKYTIFLEEEDFNTENGVVEVQLTKQRNATAEDRSRSNALLAFLTGDQFRDSQTEESQRCAVKEFERALLLFNSIGDVRGEAQTRNYLGFSLALLEDYEGGLAYVVPAIDMWKGLNDPGGEAEALNNASYAYSAIGESDKALQGFERVTSLWRSANDPESEAHSYSNLGGLYTELGEYDRAVDSLKAGQKAIKELRTFRNPTLESNLLKEIGRAEFGRKNIPAAKENFEAAIKKLPQNADAVLKAATLNSIAAVYVRGGQHAEASAKLDEALALLSTSDGEQVANYKSVKAAVLNNYGKLYLDIETIRNREKAVSYFNQALEVLDTSEYLSQPAGVLFNLANAQRDLGQLTNARASIEEAIYLIEMLRQKINRQEFRQTYFSNRRFFYDFYIDLLMRLYQQNTSAGYDEQALRASEQARGRTLFDLLIAKQGVADQKLDRSLITRLISTQRTVVQALRRRRQLLTAKHSDADLQNAEKEVQNKTRAYEAMQHDLRTSGAGLLIQLSPLYTPEMKSLLDDSTLLLEYWVAEKQIFLWVVKKDGPPISKVIPVGRADLRLKVDDLRQKLTERNCAKKNETLAQAKNRVKSADDSYPEAARELSQILLGPVSNLLGKNRLVIVADGALQLLPFAGLSSPGASPTKSFRPLLLDHEIVYLPSITVLRESQRIQPDGAAARPIALFADPVFEGTDKRIRSSSTLTKARGTQPAIKSNMMVIRAKAITRSRACLQSEEGFERLRGTRLEANRIIASLRPAKGEDLATDFNASITKLRNLNLREYRVLHLATHAFVPASQPEQATLVLSLWNERGEPQLGHLGLAEISRLDLSADLVTLSACETGLGKEVEGEGLVGLARGFMYAGTRRVAASLWKVEDRSTAELMSTFYDGIFRRKLTPAAALRRAQIAMFSRPRKPSWKAPFFWAGFSLQGDWQ
jgi:CHAT domain-containing protein